MKSSDEMFAHLLERRNDYEAARNQKRRTFMKTVFPVLSLSLMLFAGMIVRHASADAPDRSEDVNESLNEKNNRIWSSCDMLSIDGRKYYIATERAAILPEGYVFLQELSEEECMGTDLAGCKLYVPAQNVQDPYWDDFWLYQPEREKSSLVNGKGEDSLSYLSKNALKWSYIHWIYTPLLIEEEEK